MTDEVMTLAELRQAGRKVSGEHDDELDELRREVRELRARLERRTSDIRTLVGVFRQLAAHVDFPLQEAARGSEVSAPVQQPEPG